MSVSFNELKVNPKNFQTSYLKRKKKKMRNAVKPVINKSPKTIVQMLGYVSPRIYQVRMLRLEMR
jgi:hypothetical protein